MKEFISGGCLCGQVSFTIKNVFSKFHLCHCDQCKKITGSAYAANLFAEVDAIDWNAGQEYITRFDFPGRSFSKAFCRECGSGLPFIAKNGKILIVPAGSLNDEPVLAPQDNIFWRERATWLELGLSATCFDGFPQE